jgi:L-fuculose-phosphate aldolase
LVTPTHIDKMKIQPEQIVKVSLDDGHVIGEGVYSSETINHRSIYQSRTDISAIVHAHPSNAVGMVTAGYIPKTTTSEYVMLVRNLVAVDFAPAGEDSVREFTEAFSRTNIVLLKHHGVFSVGSTILEALSRIEALEEAARVEIAARSFGRLSELTDELVKSCIDTYGGKS